jgi:hypothetical protein
MGRRLRRAMALTASMTVVAALSTQASAGTAGAVLTSSAAQLGRPAGSSSADSLADPGALLQRGWRTSRDRAVTVAGDATGLHVLVADASSGYAWRTVATLGVPGVDTSRWIGQACVTGSGDRAVVVYAPRQITNAPKALGDGALASVVNLGTGKVTMLGAGVSMAYFDPGCGIGEKAVLTQGGTGDGITPAAAESTTLMVLNAVSGKIDSLVRVPGQVTSAVPFGGGIAAVRSAGVVDIGAGGGERLLARVRGSAYRLAPDGHGGLGFLVASGRQVQVRRWLAGHDDQIGTAPLGTVELSQTAGRVFITGPDASRLGRLPAGWHALDVPAGSAVSTTGQLVITAAGDTQTGRDPLASVPDAPQPVNIAARITATGRRVSFTVPAAPPPKAIAAPRALPGFPGGASETGRAAASSRPTAARGLSPSATVSPATTTYDPDRSC